MSVSGRVWYEYGVSTEYEYVIDIGGQRGV